MIHVIFKNNVSNLLLFAVIALHITWLLLNCKKVYNKWNKELRELEAQLGQIIEFEKN
jgi:hypothetical protein